MKDRKWHKGPPPHIGWWNASDAKMEDIWRWWNGQEWSAAVRESASPHFAGWLAQKNNPGSFPVYWTRRYPKRARVPRVKP